MKVRREQRLGCPKLSTQFTLNAHPKVFNVLGVDGVIIRIHKMLMMDDDIMSVNSMVDVFDLSVKARLQPFTVLFSFNVILVCFIDAQIHSCFREKMSEFERQ